MTKLYGLVACGGESSRMGADKSLLEYYDVPQYVHVYKLLQPVCEKVFISCNARQAGTIPKEYAVITDLPEYKAMGPMAGLASAFSYITDASFVLLGCDYPFITSDEIRYLVDRRDAKYMAVSYSKDDKYYEPLIAIYERLIEQQLKQNITSKQHSLNKLLREANALKIPPLNPGRLQSIDSPEGYEMAKAQIQKRGK